MHRKVLEAISTAQTSSPTLIVGVSDSQSRPSHALFNPAINRPRCPAGIAWCAEYGADIVAAGPAGRKRALQAPLQASFAFASAALAESALECRSIIPCLLPSPLVCVPSTVPRLRPPATRGLSLTASSALDGRMEGRRPRGPSTPLHWAGCSQRGASISDAHHRLRASPSDGGGGRKHGRRRAPAAVHSDSASDSRTATGSSEGRAAHTTQDNTTHLDTQRDTTRTHRSADGTVAHWRACLLLLRAQPLPLRAGLLLARPLPLPSRWCRSGT